MLHVFNYLLSIQIPTISKSVFRLTCLLYYNKLTAAPSKHSDRKSFQK